MRRRQPTWSSCVWTASPTSTWRRSLAGRRLPAIVTCRPAWEGGRFDGSEDERHAVLDQALDCGAEYVDVEWRAGFDRDHHARARRASVVSSHDFTGVPADLDARVRAMRQTGAAVIKIAVTATRLADTLPLLEIAREGDAVVIGMGDGGSPDAPAGDALRLALDLCRRRRGARTDPRAPDAGAIPVPRRGPAHEAVRRGQPERDALAVAGDAQRRVCRGRYRRGVRAAPGRRTSTTS